MISCISFHSIDNSPTMGPSWLYMVYGTCSHLTQHGWPLSWFWITCLSFAGSQGVSSNPQSSTSTATGNFKRYCTCVQTRVCIWFQYNTSRTCVIWTSELYRYLVKMLTVILTRSVPRWTPASSCIAEIYSLMSPPVYRWLAILHDWHRWLAILHGWPFSTIDCAPVLLSMAVGWRRPLNVCILLPTMNNHDHAYPQYGHPIMMMHEHSLTLSLHRAACLHGTFSWRHWEGSGGMHSWLHETMETSFNITWFIRVQMHWTKLCLSSIRSWIVDSSTRSKQTQDVFWSTHESIQGAFRLEWPPECICSGWSNVSLMWAWCVVSLRGSGWGMGAQESMCNCAIVVKVCASYLLDTFTLQLSQNIEETSPHTPL